MQSKHVKETFLLLTQVRSSPGAFADLPCSVLDAAEFYQAKEGELDEEVVLVSVYWDRTPNALERPAEATGRACDTQNFIWIFQKKLFDLREVI